MAWHECRVEHGTGCGSAGFRIGSPSRTRMSRVSHRCRRNSRSPERVDLFVSCPLVTVPLGAKLLKVTLKAVDLIPGRLGGALPRQLTGRTCYRAWASVRVRLAPSGASFSPYCHAFPGRMMSWQEGK